MDAVIFIFLGLAAGVLLLSLVLPRFFRKSIERDRQQQDLNRDQNDGRGTATWIGIRRGTGDDIDP